MGMCNYGDTPDPQFISINFLGLIVVSPTFLAEHHQTAFAAATVGLDDADCVAGTIRRLGGDAGIGSKSVICVGKPGSVRGGWSQCGSGFFLSYYSPLDAQHSAASRLDNFERLARAVSAKIGGCGGD